jgi:hypothetical protein
MLATEGVALGYDRSRLQRSVIELMLATQGVALGYDRLRFQRSGIESILAPRALPWDMIGRAFGAMVQSPRYFGRHSIR